MLRKTLVAIVGVVSIGAPALAQPAQQVVGITLADSGDTAWLLSAAVLVLLMIFPGLVLLYGGQVRAKNALSVAVHAFVIVAAVSLLWVICGYSLAFSEGTAWLGGLDNVGLANLAEIRSETTVPDSSFVLFQMMLACLAPALIIGAYAERARFGWLLCFSVLWSLCVYVPVAHSLWGGGWLASIGAHDYAGGLVIMTAAGVSALVVAVLLNARTGIADVATPPLNAAFALVGAGLLWIGWLGLSGGAALGAGDDASTAMINAHVAASAGALTWAAIERIRIGKATGIGAASGAVVGLASISAAAGYIGPLGAIVLGALAALVGYTVSVLVKKRFAIDDALNVFATFGIGGIMGAVLFPLFVPVLGGPGFDEGATLGGQLSAQATAVGAVALWSAIVTTIIGVGITLILPMRLSEDDALAAAS